MGREIKRVPMSFDFPIGASFADAEYKKHCATCGKADHDDCDWPYMDVPEGEGWQLWQTVSDGPISPVFATPEELIDFMCQPVPLAKQRERRWMGTKEDPDYPSMPWDQGWRREVAEKFVRMEGWAPSMVIVDGHCISGVDHMVATADDDP